jgi:hypothetical protein
MYGELELGYQRLIKANLLDIVALSESQRSFTKTYATFQATASTLTYRTLQDQLMAKSHIRKY